MDEGALPGEIINTGSDIAVTVVPHGATELPGGGATNSIHLVLYGDSPRQWEHDLTQSLLKLQITGTLCDLQLQGSDGMVSVHSCVMATVSRKVSALMSQRKRPRVVSLNMFPSDVITAAVQYMYSGQAMIPSSLQHSVKLLLNLLEVKLPDNSSDAETQLPLKAENGTSPKLKFESGISPKHKAVLPLQIDSTAQPRQTASTARSRQNKGQEVGFEAVEQILSSNLTELAGGGGSGELTRIKSEPIDDFDDFTREESVASSKETTFSNGSGSYTNISIKQEPTFHSEDSGSEDFNMEGDHSSGENNYADPSLEPDVVFGVSTELDIACAEAELVKPAHACSQCGKSYTSKSHLSRHVRQVHEGLRATCPECGKHVCNLRAHINSVHQKKQHVCDTCGKVFHWKSRLAKHARVHIQTPFACDLCGDRFRVYSMLAKHNKTVHGAKK